MKNFMIVVVIVTVCTLTAYAGLKIKTSLIKMNTASAAAIDKALASQ